MNAGGWIFMLISVSGVTLFFGWCLYKVLTRPEVTQHIHSPVDIDPGDRET